MAAKPNAAAQKAAFTNTAKKAAGKWKAGREAKPGEGGFKKDEIDDGIYPCVVTGRYEVGQRGKVKGHALIFLIATVDGGDFDGKAAEQMYDLNSPQDWVMESLARDLKTVMPDRSDDISGAELAELAGLIDDLNKEPATMQVEMKNSDDGKYLNPRFYIAGADGEAASTDDEPEVEVEGDGDGGDDGGDVTVEDEPEEFVPEKKDDVSFEFRKKTLTGVVLTANKAEKTARVNVDGRTYGPIAWDKLTKV